MSGADIRVQNAQLHVTYSSTSTEPSSIRPRLLFCFDFTQGSELISAPRRSDSFPPSSSHVSSANILVVSDFTVELRMLGASNNDQYYVGPLFSKQPVASLYNNARTNIIFGLDLNHFDLREIEKLRESKDLQFVANFSFSSEIQHLPQTKQPSSFQLRFKIPKSDWVETLLPALGLKTVSLIEIPKLAGSEVEELISHVDDAWKQYSMGEYHRVLTDCRKALESLGSIAKSKGYKKTTAQQDEKKTLPDWDKLLGNEELGDVVGTINKKTMAFIAPAAHSGRTINREDADFALMVTHAMVNLITRKLAETS